MLVVDPALRFCAADIEHHFPEPRFGESRCDRGVSSGGLGAGFSGSVEAEVVLDTGNDVFGHRPASSAHERFYVDDGNVQ